MSSLPKSVLREMITRGNLKTADDLHSYLKDMFKDALQEMLEAELEAELGYAKGDKKNKENGKIDLYKKFIHLFLWMLFTTRLEKMDKLRIRLLMSFWVLI